MRGVAQKNLKQIQNNSPKRGGLNCIIDQSGLYALESIIIDLIQKGKRVLLVGIDQQPRYMMERIDIIPDLIPQEQIFDEFNGCVKWMIKFVEDEYTV